eukprot:SAG22_NODE_12614_length_436_cov_0.756677_1_plen_30_part_10
MSLCRSHVNSLPPQVTMVHLCGHARALVCL